MRLILASASPRRAELLRAAGFTFETRAVDVDERVRAGERAASYVRRLAAEKSAAALKGCVTSADEEGCPTSGGVAQGFSPADIVVLGADTAVVIDDDILGKPRDDGDAAAMLQRLSGRRHDVTTGVSVRTGAHEVGRVETTTVHFAPLGPHEIAWYVASGEGRDKAGAYAVQGFASRFIPRIEGSYSNVVGLPVGCVYELLKELGVDYSDSRPDSWKSL